AAATGALFAAAGVADAGRATAAGARRADCAEADGTALNGAPLRVCICGLTRAATGTALGAAEAAFGKTIALTAVPDAFAGKAAGLRATMAWLPACGADTGADFATGTFFGICPAPATGAAAWMVGTFSAGTSAGAVWATASVGTLRGESAVAAGFW